MRNKRMWSHTHEVQQAASPDSGLDLVSSSQKMHHRAPGKST